MLNVESPWDRPLAVEGAAIVADWGVRPVAGPSEVLYVDHHADSAPVRVHPLVAAAWSRWLAPRVVIAANDGWRRGKVSFAVRCAADRDLRAWLLARWTPPPGSGDYARGHRRATGGSLAPEAFKLFSTAVLPSGAT